MSEPAASIEEICFDRRFRIDLEQAGPSGSGDRHSMGEPWLNEAGISDVQYVRPRWGFKCYRAGEDDIDVFAFRMDVHATRSAAARQFDQMDVATRAVNRPHEVLDRSPTTCQIFDDTGL